MDTREETVEDSPVILLLSTIKKLPMPSATKTGVARDGIMDQHRRTRRASTSAASAARTCHDKSRRTLKLQVATIQVHSVRHIRQRSEARPVHDPGDGVAAKIQVLQSRQSHKPSGCDGGQVGVPAPYQRPVREVQQTHGPSAPSGWITARNHSPIQPPP
jgi:hypothetical protein